MASIVFLPKRAGRLNRLTLQDRHQITSWCQSRVGKHYEITISSDADEDIGDFISICRSNEAWARWAVARRGSRLQLWCAIDGLDIGHFESMSQALSAIPAFFEGCVSGIRHCLAEKGPHHAA